MFDHVTIGAGDRAASERFYDAVLAALGRERTATGEDFTEWDDFSLAPAGDGATGRGVTRGLHLAFGARSREEVDAFHRAGLAAGFTSDGDPGPRPRYLDDYYGGFLLDPDGNSVEAVHHGASRRGTDHLWIRVADVAAAKRFYATIAPHAGFALDTDTADRVSFTAAGPGGGTFSLVHDERPRTEHVHVAFTARDEAAVRDFHTAATLAGYEDHGAPGERPEYHPGYYAAFVLDPDGHNVELVEHHRG